MPHAPFANPFRARTPALLSSAALQRIAASPSHRAPRVQDVRQSPCEELPAPPPGEAVAGRAFLVHGARWKLREVRLVAIAPFLDELANAAHLAFVTHLDLRGNRIGADGLKRLAESPYAHFTHLNLAANALDDASLAILRAPAFADLEELSLARNAFRVCELHLPKLRRLSVAGNALDSGVRLPELESLDLGECGGYVPAPSATLVRLNLAFNELPPGWLAGDFPRLRELSLRGNRLSQLPMLERLETLDVAVNVLGDAGILGCDFSAMRRLNLAGNGVTDCGVQALAGRGAFAQLEHLSLAWNPCGDACLPALADAPNLRTLDLTGTRITLAGARLLTQFDKLQMLTRGENANLPPHAVQLLAARFGTTTTTPEGIVAWP